MTVVSLTSIPPRFDILQKTIVSLLKQTAKIEEIRVNIPRSYRRFPEGSFSMPEFPEGARLVVLDEDLGPATKVLPTLRDLAGTSTPVVYCDDDRIVHDFFVSDLLDGAKEQPDCIIANSGWDLERLDVYPQREETHYPRARRLKSFYDVPYRLRRLKQGLLRVVGEKTTLKPKRSRSFLRKGYLDIMEGAGGVLLYPASLSEESYLVPEKVWAVDDIWLSGMAAKNGVKIWSNDSTIPSEIPGAEVDALCNTTIEGLNRYQANLECVRLLQRDHGIWIE